jgi:hypothetical protein
LDSPDLDPPLGVSKYEIEDKKVRIEIIEQSQMHQENPHKIKENVDSAPLDMCKETQVLPNSTPLVS